MDYYMWGGTVEFVAGLALAIAAAWLVVGWCAVRAIRRLADAHERSAEALSSLAAARSRQDKEP